MIVVKVDWDDSCDVSGWVRKSSFEPEVSQCTTVGFLVKKTKDYVSIASSSSDSESWSDIMTIPRKCVKTITIMEAIHG